MKKSLIALSVACAFGAAGVASAAEVQLYGLIDTGLTYVHTDGDTANVGSSGKLTMESGREFGSRWGIRGTEKISDDFKVGFVLESGFRSDAGTFDQTGKLFGRESHVDLYTNYGTFSFGLMPVFGSVLGANGLFRAIDPLFANYTEAFGSGYASASRWTRVDNTISYVTPTFSGFTGYAMYSLKMDGYSGVGDEGKASSDRYGSLAMRYKGSQLEAILVADMTMYGNSRTGANYHDDSGYTVTLGGNWAFENGWKVIAFAQYFKDQEINTNARAGVVKGGLQDYLNYGAADQVGTGGYGFVDGWGASIGAHMPLWGGTLKGQIAYRDMDNEVDVDFTRWLVALGYDYNLSKRTAVYAMTGFSQEKIEMAGASDVKPNGYEFTIGLLHRF